MCGRFTLRSDAEVIADAFGIAPLEAYAPRYNIAPSQPVLAILAGREAREARLLKWGLVPSWAKDPAIGNRMINARAETVTEKPSFRNAIKRRRCLIPADGWYEWQSVDGGRQPWYIRGHDDRPFGFAGLWEYWERDGSVIESCCIITTAAAGRLGEVHARMPVVIEAAAHARWLDHASETTVPLDLLQAGDETGFDLHPVSKTVNSPRNDTPDCITPLDG